MKRIIAMVDPLSASMGHIREGRMKAIVECRVPATCGHSLAKEIRIFPERPARAACATASLILRIG